MLEHLINAVLKTIIIVIIFAPIWYIKNKIEKNAYVDEKKDEYAEYDKEFFENLKKKNEEYDKEKK